MFMNYNTLKQLFFKLDPENAHSLAEFGLSMLEKIPFGLDILAKNFSYDDEILAQQIFDINFPNPLGIAGGFDKNATMIAPLCALGYGFLEYGTLTPLAQPGNPKPRLFRLIEEESIQNAMGFNNEGMGIIAKNVAKYHPFKIPLFANIGKNKITPNEKALFDYEILIRGLENLSDAFVLNISSPNTPNLRALQEGNFVSELFDMVSKNTKKPAILKIAPDMSEKKAVEICTKAIEFGAKGIIINNTSIDYSLSKNSKDFGGLSGRVITEKSRKMFEALSKELYQKAVLISSGGIDNAEEAYTRVKDGASLVQIFTAFIFKGPGIAKDINSNLAALLRADGFKNLGEAVGVNRRTNVTEI